MIATSHRPLRKRLALGWILAMSATLIAPACRSSAAVSRPRTHPETACRSSMTAVSPTGGDGVYAVAGEDPSHHFLRFVDGQLSRNDSCMIRLGNRLNRRVPPMYVNGQPVGFC